MFIANGGAEFHQALECRFDVVDGKPEHRATATAAAAGYLCHPIEAKADNADPTTHVVGRALERADNLPIDLTSLLLYNG